MKDKKSILLAVDGNSIINRAYYGIRMLTTKDGLCTNAVYGMITMLHKQLEALEPGAFPFKIIDYDTHPGIDVIVKATDNVPIRDSKLYYVEFKNYLKKDFNHSFENLHSIVCWDIDPKIIKNGDEVSDIAGTKRVLRIVPPKSHDDRTYYFLDDIRSSHKIQVFVLKHYLEEKLGIKFRTRTEADYF